MPSRPRRAAVPAVTIDPENVTASAAACALFSGRAAPLGRDTFGRALSFVALRFHSTPRSRRRTKPLPFAARIASLCLRGLFMAHLAFVVSTCFALVLFKSVDPPATTLMFYRAVFYGWKVSPPRYLPLARIPKTTRNMAVRVEDGTFFEHHGIEPAAIKNAYRLNKGFGEPIYGGSTITMQTARTIFLVPEKSYVRKWLELIVALEMEAILGKERILELYFNYAEWGKGIFGIEAASRFHYKKGVAALSRDQTIRLITLLSSPIRYGPYNFSKNGILQSRFLYLDQRYGDSPPVAPAPSAAQAEPAPPAAEPAATAEPMEPVPPAAPAETAETPAPTPSIQ